MKFKTKPVEIEAVQWFKAGDHPAVIFAASLVHPGVTDKYVVKGAQGHSTVNPGDWIIAEPRGDGFYPCNPEVFAAKYEPA